MSEASLDVAIVGLACRFAGAASAAAFWDGLAGGVELVRDLSREELLAAGVPAADLDRPAYVRRRGVVEDVDLFAASFFGYGTREAETMDPQHRLFLECAWEALEDAACDPERADGLIGVFASASTSTYRPHLDRHAGPDRMTGFLRTDVGCDVDFLAGRVSYKLGLHGPSLAVQTACSSSLVAVHVACQSLAHEECDLALAGGVSILVPKAGHVYRPGGIASPDGRCRAFDARAAGTVGGDGVGVVALKRLADAVSDGDHVYAVIKGSAVNNDGARRVGFAAPAVQGQAEVIAEAQAVAGVEPRTIGYVEAHGTGTVVGDPIEVRALSLAFAAGTRDRGFCALGAVETNVGHLDAAAGIAGLVKTALALYHRQIPPTLHFETPNPACELEASPFTVNRRLLDWDSPGSPRRAGVSAFGIGGTNAHVVLEEAPAPAPTAPGRPGDLLLLSARSATALDAMAAGLAAHLAAHPEHDLADVAHTLRVGRQQFEHRLALVCEDRDHALRALAVGDGWLTARTPERDRPVLFLLADAEAPPPSSQELHRDEPVYRKWADRCRDLPGAASYALVRTLMEWGITPSAIVGNGAGVQVARWLGDVETVRPEQLQEGEPCVVLAVGPHDQPPGHEVVAMPRLERGALLETLARLWLAGVTIDWRAYDETGRRRRLSLPSYPFERQRCWVGPPGVEEVAAGVESHGEAAPTGYLPREGLRAYVPPEGPFQARVAAIWEDVIGIGQVGATDDFYELGGNSLVAVQVLARLQEAFDVDLPPRLLLGRPRVADVAARIEELVLARPR
jgi:acyl transferase domain-containing protein/acyl carrier protein